MILLLENIKNAFRSIWQNKVQSFLAILGVIIGVSSVTILISLGQGLKNDVAHLIQGFGTNVLIVISGKIDSGGSLNQSNPANFITGDILTEKDVDSMSQIENIEAVTPLSLVSGAIKYNGKVSSSTISGSYPNVLDAFQVLTVAKGTMFTAKGGDVVVLGPTGTKDLFENDNPIGKKVMIGERVLEVVGTLAKPQSSSIFGSEFDTLSFIPFDTATLLNKGQVKIFRIAAKARDDANVNDVKKKVQSSLLTNHNSEENFSVLTQDDLLGLFNTFLNLATLLVTAIAAISLIVGGIGIMNIMLVTVTERTREIGLRKALGATKLAILIQFLTESLVITLVGGITGLVLSFATITLIARQTALQPSITPTVILMAVGLSCLIGIIFGLWPALRAALKDPIEALRYE